MSILDRFQAYAAAFEESYVDDDWSRLEEFFTEDAVYEGDPDARGRGEVLAKLKNGVDTFDREMDRRIPDFQTPTVDGDTLTLRWTVTYEKAGRPDLALTAERARRRSAATSSTLLADNEVRRVCSRP